MNHSHSDYLLKNLTQINCIKNSYHPKFSFIIIFLREKFFLYEILTFFMNIKKRKYIGRRWGITNFNEKKTVNILFWFNPPFFWQFGSWQSGFRVRLKAKQKPTKDCFILWLNWMWLLFLIYR